MKDDDLDNLTDLKAVEKITYGFGQINENSNILINALDVYIYKRKQEKKTPYTAYVELMLAASKLLHS